MDDDTCAVCGGGVHEAETITTTHEGDVYRFCSDEHRTEFEKSTELFA